MKTVLTKISLVALTLAFSVSALARPTTMDFDWSHVAGRYEGTVIGDPTASCVVNIGVTRATALTRARLTIKAEADIGSYSNDGTMWFNAPLADFQKSLVDGHFSGGTAAFVEFKRWTLEGKRASYDAELRFEDMDLSTGLKRAPWLRGVKLGAHLEDFFTGWSTKVDCWNLRKVAE